MSRLLLRFGPLVVALVFVAMSWGSWHFGNPPTYTVFSPRVETVVVRSGVESYRIGNGTTRHDPVVEVSWPPGSGVAVALQGLIPEFFRHRAKQAEAIAAGYVAGETVRVKVHEGAPFADQLRWFGLVHAVFSSLFSLVLLGLALVFWRAFEPVRR